MSSRSWATLRLVARAASSSPAFVAGETRHVYTSVFPAMHYSVVQLRVWTQPNLPRSVPGCGALPRGRPSRIMEVSHWPSRGTPLFSGQSKPLVTHHDWTRVA